MIHLEHCQARLTLNGKTYTGYRLSTADSFHEVVEPVFTDLLVTHTDMDSIIDSWQQQNPMGHVGFDDITHSYELSNGDNKITFSQVYIHDVPYYRVHLNWELVAVLA